METGSNPRILTNPYARALEGFGMFFGIGGSVGSFITACIIGGDFAIFIAIYGIICSIIACVLFLGASEIINLLDKNESHLRQSEEYLKDIRDAFASYDNQNDYSEGYEAYTGEVIDELPEL